MALGNFEGINLILSLPDARG